MAGIQIGGIVSGMDTNSLVDQLTAQANVAVDRLKGQLAYKAVEQETYTDVDDKLKGMSGDLLSLRLKSTFLTKNVTSTNENVASATATTDSDIGSFSLKVDQLAKNSYASSSVTHVALSQAGSSVSSVSGTPVENLEGSHNVTISNDGTNWLSTDEFTVNNVGAMQKQAGSTFSGVTNGNLTADVSGSLTFSYTDKDGNAQTISMNGTYGTTGEDINSVAASIEKTLNDGLNSSMGTSNVQYAAIRAEYNSGSWNFALYNTTIDSHNIKFGGTDADTLRDELGFSESSSPTISTSTKIMKYQLGTSASDLQSKLTNADYGLLPGAAITLSGALTTGSFVVAQDATLKVSAATYTKYISDTVTTGTLDLNAVGLQNAGFERAADTSLNGTFTINNIPIVIDDYTKLSVSDLMGVINSSGAGVKATYDTTEKKITLTSNDSGPKSITLGSFSDTSSIFKLLKLDQTSTTTYTKGTTSGSINTTDKLSDAGLTTTPYSGTITINGISIYVDASKDSLDDLMEKVNKSGAGVNMTYDATSDKIKLVSDDIEPITVGSPSDTSNILEALNLVDYNGSSAVKTTIGTEGQRAVFSVDGTTYIRDKNTVDDVVNGVTLTLNSAGSDSTTVKVGVDPDKGLKAFANFVKHYNELMEKMDVPEKDDSEKQYTDYLTDAKKAKMSESDIEEYKKNYDLYNGYDVIRRSSELRGLKLSLRSSFFQERSGIQSSVNDMSDLGIQVAGAGNLTEEVLGYLVTKSTDLDTITASLQQNDKFMTALKNNPKDVYKFFANSSDLDINSAQTPAEKQAIEERIQNESGWARYFDDDVISRYTAPDGFIGSKVGSTGTIQSSMNQIEQKIVSQQDRVQMEMERYWQQFSKMEQAIADAQSQSSSLGSLAGSAVSGGTSKK